MLAASPFDSPESALEWDTENFIQEEDDSNEVFELPKFEAPTRPPIELKPLPYGLRYAFLNNDVESPIIINDKLSEEEITKLIVVLEKHRSILGYAL